MMIRLPSYRNTSVKLLDETEDNAFAEVNFNHDDVLYRGIKLVEDEKGAYVKYPVRKRVKNGQPVFNRYGTQVEDYIFRPTANDSEYYDTAIMNAYFRACKKGEIDMADIPFDDESRVVSVCRVNVPKRGIIGFAEIQYRGMMINDIAIVKAENGETFLVFPHYTEKKADGTEVKKLFIYPQKEELAKIKKLIFEEFNNLRI